jgi:putative membrane protein
MTKRVYMAGYIGALSLALSFTTVAQEPRTETPKKTTPPQNQTSSPTSPQTTSADDTTTKTKKSTTKTTDDSTRNRTTDANASGAMLGAKDRQFVMKAYEGGQMEIQMAQTAQSKASSEAVKQFAQKIEADHTQANKELAEIAKNKGLDLTANPPATQHHPEMDKLSSLSGAAFDKAYLKAMVRDHRKDVKEFQKESTDGMDSDVKAFAAKTLPVIQDHLRRAEELEKTAGGGGSASSGASTTEKHSKTSKDSSKTPSTDTTPTPPTTPPPQK